MTFRLAAIVSVDLLGYSSASERNEDAAMDAVGFMRLQIEEAANNHNGRIFSSAGDGCMLEFSSVRQAADFSLQLVAAFRANEQCPPLRVGLHFGEVRHAEDDDLLGHAVNMAARIQALAKPNSVLASEEVARQLSANPNVRVRPAGRRRLGKMRTDVKTFEILSAEGYAGSSSRNVWKRRDVLAGAGLAAGGGLAAVVWLATKKPKVSVLAAFPLDASDGADADERSLASGASRRLLEHMSAATDVILIGKESLGAVADLPKRDAAIRLEAHLGLSGRFASAGERYEIEVSLWRVQPPLVLLTRTISGDLRHLESGLGELSAEVLASVGSRQPASTSAVRRRDAAIVASLDEASDLLRQDSPEALERARALFTRMTELAPSDARAFRGLGACWLAMSARTPDPGLKAKRVVEAEFAIRRALFLESGSGEARAQLAEIEGQLAQWAESAASAEAALQLEPGNGLVHHHLATVYAKFGFLGRSFAHASRARTSDPLSGRILRDWALIGILAGRAAEVEQVLTAGRRTKLSAAWIEALSRAEQGRYRDAAVLIANDATVSAGFRSWIETGAAVERGDAPTLALSAPAQPADWPYWLAEMTLLGRLEDAGRGLASCLQANAGPTMLRHIPVEWLFLPSLKALRDTSACHNAFVQIGLDAFWRRQGQPDFRS